MGLLHWLRQHVAQWEIEIVTVELPAVLPEHGQAGAHRLFPHDAFVAILAPEGMQLGNAGPLAEAEVDTPVGYFFDAFFQAGLYYQFVGVAQVTAGLLLLFPRTSLIGAVLYFPIIVNIAVVTNSLPFGNTGTIAVLMLLANLYLLCWDYGRLRPVLFPRAAALAPHDPVA